MQPGGRSQESGVRSQESAISGLRWRNGVPNTEYCVLSTDFFLRPPDSDWAQHVRPDLTGLHPLFGKSRFRTAADGPIGPQAGPEVNDAACKTAKYGRIGQAIVC